MSGIQFNRHIILSNKLLVAMSGLSSWTYRNGKYVYEKHNYHISKPYIEQKWSKSTIRQFLAYVSLCNSEGAIHFVSEKDLGKMTGLSVRTIQENNKIFSENGILAYRRIWGEFLDVNIHNYKEEVRDLEIKEDGQASSKTGYTSIWFEVIEKLMSIKNINQLRLALRALVAYEKEVNLQELDEAILSYDEIKGFLPSYIGYKKAIREMVDGLSSFLHINCLESAEVVRELFHRQPKKRPSLMEKLSKPFALAVSLTGDQDSKKIKYEERQQSHLHWFEFKKSVRGFLPVDRAELSSRDLQSFSDTYGASFIGEALGRLSRSITSTDVPYERLLSIVEDFKTNTSEFLARHLHNFYQAKTIEY